MSKYSLHTTSTMTSQQSRHKKARVVTQSGDVELTGVFPLCSFFLSLERFDPGVGEDAFGGKNKFMIKYDEKLSIAQKCGYM